MLTPNYIVLVAQIFLFESGLRLWSYIRAVWRCFLCVLVAFSVILLPRSRGCFRRATFIALRLLILMGLVRHLYAQEPSGNYLVVPNDAASRPGSGSSDVPFSGFNEFLIQVYDASQFSPLAPGAFLTGVSFRSQEALPNGFDVTYTHFELHLATFSQPIAALPDSFTPSHYPDTTRVFSKDNVRLSGSGSLSSVIPAPFEIRLSFDRPFYYDPSAGNLLMYLASGNVQTAIDIRVDFDASLIPPFAYSLSSAAASQGNPPYPGGLVAQFDYTVVPEPSASLLIAASLLVFQVLMYVTRRCFT